MSNTGLCLGISGMRRLSTAAIVRRGQAVAACEEAKLAGRAGAPGLPREAIRFCLERAGAGTADVTTLALDEHPWKLWGSEVGFRLAKFTRAPKASVYYGIESFNRIRELLNNERLLTEMFPNARIEYVDHHAAHAAAAFYPSGFERALILTLDSGGAFTSGQVAGGQGASITPHRAARFPNSPGFLYSQVTTMLGWRAGHDENRTQWLSTTGQPRYRAAFDAVLAPLKRGELRIDQRCFNRGVSETVCLAPAFVRELGVAGGDWRPVKRLPLEQRADIAASLQAALEDAVVALAAFWRERTGHERLCFGGGVAFNSLLVGALAERAGFGDGYVSPAAGNAGSALGAAWWLAAAGGERPDAASFTPWLGPSYTAQQLKDLLDNCRLPYRNLTPPQLVQEVAERLAKGAIVAWFQGPAEIGPRALGNRSILCAPADEWVKENLNAFTKRRESYRPLAASVIEESAAEYFEFPWRSPVTYLGTVARVKDPAAIPGLAFGGNQARVHVVSRQANRPFHELLTRVGQITGRPLLINTSFNTAGDPLVVTPQDALRVFYSTGLDCLALGDFLLAK
jgi:carbamoyltransferase